MDATQALHLLEAAQLAYKARNYAETYQISSKILLEKTALPISAEAYTLKGMSAGWLSTYSNNRFEEMLSYVDKGREINDDPERLLWIATEMASLTSTFAQSLQTHYTAENEGVVQSTMSSGVTVRYSNEGIGEALGRGIGQGLADGMEKAQKRKKATVSLGISFIKEHMQPLVEAMKFAYYNAAKKPSVAIAIGSAINAIIDTSAISPRARQEFSHLVDRLTVDIINAHPDVTIYYTKDPEAISCPKCGYESVKSENTGCNPFLAVITLGLHPLIQMIENLTGGSSVGKESRIGQKLYCSVCNHIWEHKG